MPKLEKIENLNFKTLVCAFLLFLIVPMSVFSFLVFDKNSYVSNAKAAGNFDENNVFAVKAVNDLISFFKFEGEVPSQFSEKEKMHLFDVRLLISQVLIFFYSVSVVFCLFSLFLITKIKKFSLVREFVCRVLSETGLMGIFVITFFGSLMFFLFGPIFSLFHAVFFASGTFEFAGTDLLISLFGGSFFQNFAVQIISWSFFAFASLILASLLIRQLWVAKV